MARAFAVAQIAVLACLLVFGSGLVRAQTLDAGRAWVQVEALPDLASAQDRARAYGVDFGNVTGFQLESGWYAILLGPFAAAEAPSRLADLRLQGRIPPDSYIASENSFVRQFWPAGQGTVIAALPPAEPVEPPVAAAPATTPVLEPVAPFTAAPALPDETPAEARRAEAALPLADRQALQTALAWAGFYSAAIDGAFGPGTRTAMAAWQTVRGLDATGVLTSAERAALLEEYRADLAALGLQTVRDEAAGIEIMLPTAMVEFAAYEPPFVHFAPRNGSGVEVHLISQPGDQASLSALYDILQTLAIVPPQGFRERSASSFVITGQSSTLNSHTYAGLQGGLIKGYTLTWNPADEARMTRVLAAMQRSFTPFGDYALDEALAAPTDEQRRDLLAGLEVRRPVLSRSGFYIDAQGRVLTTPEAVEGCTRITLDETEEATLTLNDMALGLALLTPVAALVPQVFAQFQAAVPRLQSEIAVAGYSYGDALSQPSLTFGRLEDLRGLEDGQDELRRLAIPALPGDAGGPVLDRSGRVIGMLLPRDTKAARVLPGEVAFALGTPAIVEALGVRGILVPAAPPGGAVPPEDVARIAAAMTVLVSCWR